jgi:Domain of unknown function (DUF6265)
MSKTTIACAALAALCGLTLGATAIAQNAPTAPAVPGPPVPSAAQTPPVPPAVQTAPAARAESKPAATAASAEADLATQFAWLEGCWRGQVNQREFREHWLPPRGGLMIGAGHTVASGKTQEYEYLRLEPRVDGIYYINIAMAPGKQETAYRLVDRKMDREDEIFTFANPEQDFPQTISYRHNSGGWLFATVEGKIEGTKRQVIYPMHRINCETGEAIEK